jgi:hypothetical protein
LIKVIRVGLSTVYSRTNPTLNLYELTAATIMLSHGIPPVIVAGMLGHTISILLNTYAHFIPTMQDQAAQLMDYILTPIAIEMPK